MFAWNNHPLSSEGNLTPNQLWTVGLVQNNEDPFMVEVCLNIGGCVFSVTLLYSCRIIICMVWTGKDHCH